MQLKNILALVSLVLVSGPAFAASFSLVCSKDFKSNVAVVSLNEDTRELKYVAEHGELVLEGAAVRSIEPGIITHSLDTKTLSVELVKTAGSSAPYSLSVNGKSVSCTPND